MVILCRAAVSVPRSRLDLDPWMTQMGLFGDQLCVGVMSRLKFDFERNARETVKNLEIIPEMDR